MMVGQSIRARIKSGQCCFGLSLVLPCPSTIELAMRCGYDFIRIDWEHSLFGAEELRSLLTTARLLGMPCQVRVPSLEMVTPLLGQDPLGIMVPHVDSEKSAKRAIDCCKFAPLGTRGMDGNTRLMRCEGINRNDYMAYETENMDLIIQLESRAAIANADHILSLEGIDMVATGRADLSQEFGVPGHKDHPEVIAAENLIIQKALEHGKIPAIAADSKERVLELQRMGVRCFLIGKDESLLANALQKNLQEKGRCKV